MDYYLEDDLNIHLQTLLGLVNLHIQLNRVLVYVDEITQIALFISNIICSI